jgi:hypothetical protein
MVMIKLCKICNNEIPRGNMSTTNKKYQAKKYCSNKCHHKDMKKEFEYKCEDCGETLIRTKEGITSKVFCNDICKGRYTGKTYKNKIHTEERITKTCLNCSETYNVIKSRADSKFCKIKCRAEFNAKTIEKKQVEVCCNNCGSKFNKVPSDIRELNFCKTSCMHEYYSNNRLFSGMNSGTWNGGKKTYYGENWLSQRRKIRERDNYTCQKCEITEEEYGQELSVHHIKPFILFNDYLEANKDDNLISVCEPCHRKIHSGDNHPSKFFKRLMI